jgi:nitroimidazol reductase NimA-like FMN-containing flavoprotein (pyridoxamine 5'-phosphate oxidase superfamily)
MDSTDRTAPAEAIAKAASERTLRKTARSKLKRLPKRGHYDFDTVAAILDAGFLCHVGYVVDGAPLVTPTAYWREGRRVYWHGSHASRMLNTAAAGVPVCLTVAHVDGLVMARSAFHFSINYRSVMLMGTANVVRDAEHKRAAMREFVNRIGAGRWDDLRPVTHKELKATTVLWMDIDEGSAKVRTGPPIDDEEDYALPIWAGVVPIRMVAGAPMSDPRLASGIAAPDSLSDLTHLGLAMDDVRR